MSKTNDNRFIQPYLSFDGSCEQTIDEDRLRIGWMIGVAPSQQG
jgi:hypothetical protein